MMRHILTACCLLLVFAASGAAEEALPGAVEQMLASRKVLGTVQFSVGSAALDDAARSEIDKAAKRLADLPGKGLFVRIEGFASPEGGDSLNIPISVMRARAVEEYLASRGEMAVEIYLSGFVDRSEKSGLSMEQRRRAEIALYDNIWKMQPIPVDETILEWQTNE